ncbi:GNAT family N-acetyltransferase [Agrococcus sp. ARC_14]|uniref:GNAT family N-acetyltransferase n=1 Tax=Agrococcus sp. ARC_14 TaxID=2919927 RepID=UPI001F051E90|nr:GNAT family N-acetyltransferase [Agrococcus sp. ARC_14]MCH1882737.1 GNAT family N-acetyltransferase [Agrococcus sp. ARC_14]
MHTITIDDLVLPASWDDASDAGETFRAAAAHADRVGDARYGAGVTTLTLPERLAAWQSTDAERVERAVVRAGDRVIAASAVWLPQLESTDIGDHMLTLEPDLPDADRRAILEALLDHVERIAAAYGRTTLMGGSPARADGALTAATGFGAVDPDEPEAAALIARGYALEQVYRMSVADLRELEPTLDERWSDASAAAAQAGYDTVAWSGPTPAEHRSAMRTLHERMSTDAPVGGLALEPEVWSDERLAEFERSKTEGGRTMRTVVARHIASGELAGFTSLFVGSGDVARQHDTLVSRDHRGRRLGMLLKLANLVQLRDHHPTHPRVSTMNAEENRHMLSVNEATGFLPVGYEAVWQRKDAA